MHAQERLTLGMGLAVGLSLGVVGLGCNEMSDGAPTPMGTSITSENGLSMNGLSMNGLSMNGLSMNGLSMNGLSMNGLSMNGLATASGLSSTSGLMTTDGGREVVKYMVKCALPAGQSLTKQDALGNSYTFTGAIGIAPEALNGPCDLDCQERMSACILAHVNNSGMHVGIWIVGPDAAVGWGSNPDYPFQEGAFFGNLISVPWQGYFCGGKDMSSGEVPGRLGSPLASTVYTNPYGYNMQCGTNCVVTNQGYTQCNDNWPKAPYPSAARKWNHVVTVWRNFEPSLMYKICTKSTPERCLGVAGSSSAEGATIEQRTYGGATGQKWQILQVEPGKYKFVNVASGRVLDARGVQRAYTGAAEQKIAVAYLGSEVGWANLLSASLPAWQVLSADTGNDGAPLKVGAANPDYAKWGFTALGPVSGGTTGGGTGGSSGGSGSSGGGSLFDASRTYHLIPQSAANKSVDVCGGSQNVNTCVQQYATDFNNPNQAFYLLPSGSNWKIAMKANQSKCLGGLNNGTSAGTPIVVQDCNGGANQAFTATLDSATGTYIFKHVANSGVCLDVSGGTSADGAKVQLYSCWSPPSQKFKVQ
jgi:hypothetical protein